MTKPSASAPSNPRRCPISSGRSGGHAQLTARLSSGSVKIVLDTTILVRAHERSHGAARKSCPLDPLVLAPIRDVNDIIVMQTAIIGEADILCTMDEDFFESPASEYLRKMNIAVLDDIALMQRLRSMR